MSALEIARAHQKFTNNFSTGKFECFFEQLAPFGFTERVVLVEPIRKSTMRIAHGLNDFGVVNGGFNFKAIADYRCILHETLKIMRIKAGNLINIEILKSYFKARTFLQNN